MTSSASARTELDDTDDLRPVLERNIVAVLADRCGMDPARATQLARESIARTQGDVGGRRVYLRVLNRQVRDQAMRLAFDARRRDASITENMEMTAREFGVCQRTVRRVCCS
ncbi:hypothetical protein JN531_012690 [Flagellatimonas centrodinii]|uniref:Mor transcription activator family protein n=1 Tax=Flagellatimonas centrodinii TaxID=2806210 RepID=UPI001FEE9EEB|nr:Mor transcription activator family protein [Flagellatimonas centrodinii]ULQ45957.1 hypothetical protein JN531_012690 [Flagellatimonas centrodinii]